ncbi:uncharacterized protein LOC127881344 [Dreissena polymorpha]|uniref:uncharacterized protein LOC127881344 n=1 Tax=Dreissena polymorpha TaxID=45954 RepID=UPI00226500AE|nr:uncharacterized protein LOC127881344 [Dreissena polymorpha]
MNAATHNEVDESRYWSNFYELCRRIWLNDRDRNLFQNILRTEFESLPPFFAETILMGRSQETIINSQQNTGRTETSQQLEVVFRAVVDRISMLCAYYQSINDCPNIRRYCFNVTC